MKNNMGMTEAEIQELTSLREGVELKWVDGEKDPMDVAYEHAYAYVQYKTGIKLQRKKKHEKKVA